MPTARLRGDAIDVSMDEDGTLTLRRGFRCLTRADNATLADYGTACGSLALRRLLARRFAGGGLDVTSEQLLLVASGAQAVDLICRFLLKLGDTVLVDDPCYFNCHALLRAHHLRIVGVLCRVLQFQATERSKTRPLHHPLADAADPPRTNLLKPLQRIRDRYHGGWRARCRAGKWPEIRPRSTPLEGGENPVRRSPDQLRMPTAVPQDLYARQATPEPPRRPLR